MLKSKFTKLFLMLGMILLSLFGVAGCTDYGYYFHFDVDGGNGKIQIYDSISENSIWKCRDENNNACELECSNSSRVAALLGGKNGSATMTFIAIPDEGYVVKEWIFNGKIVDGNKTNSFVAKVTSEQGYNGVIVVRFELEI